MVQGLFWKDNLYLEEIDITKWRYKHSCYAKTLLYTEIHTSYLIFHS